MTTSLGEILFPRKQTFVGHPRDYIPLDNSDEDDEMKRWVLSLNCMIEKPKFYEFLNRSPARHPSRKSPSHGNSSKSWSPAERSPRKCGNQTPDSGTPSTSGYQSPSKQSPKYRPKQNQEDRRRDRFQPNCIPRDPRDQVTYWSYRQEDIRRLKDAIGRKAEGDNRVERGELELAVDVYTNTIDICRSFPSDEVRLNRGICYSKLGMFEEAGRDINFVLYRHYKNVRALYHRARLYHLMNDHKAADNCYIMCFNLCRKHVVWSEMMSNRMDHLKEMFARTKWINWSFIEKKVALTEDLKEAEEFVWMYKNNPKSFKKDKDGPPLPLPTKEPLNIFQSNTIWIYGANYSLEELYQTFAKFGQITELKLMAKDGSNLRQLRRVSSQVQLNRHSVSYKSPKMASFAIQAMNEREITLKGDGKNSSKAIKVRFARNNQSAKWKMAKCRKWGACYFWRTTGKCPRQDVCPFHHFEPDRHVDHHPPLLLNPPKP